MSEIRETAIVETFEVPTREPMIAMRTILQRVGAALTAAAHPFAGERSAPSLTLDKAAMLNQAESARTALVTLEGLRLPQTKAMEMQGRVRTLLQMDDRAGVAQLARESVLERQERLHATLPALVEKACQKAGLMVSRSGHSGEVVMANRPGTRQTVTVEVAKSKDGQVRLCFDADGFHGSACVETLETISDHLRQAGVIVQVESSRRKESRSAYEAPRLPTGRIQTGF